MLNQIQESSQEKNQLSEIDKELLEKQALIEEDWDKLIQYSKNHTEYQKD